MQHYPDFRFVDTALRGKESRNDIMSIEQYAQVLLSPNNRIGQSTTYINRFRSWCRFDQSYESYWLQNKNKWGNSSVKQYEGAHIFDYLFWDIDKANKNEQGVEIADLAESTRLLQQLLEHLEKSWGLAFEHFCIWLTAGKGYHPYLRSGAFQPWPHDLNAAAAAHFTADIFPEGWVKKHQLGGVLDPTTFKDLNRLDRQGGSQNFKEGREWNGFKVGMTREMWDALQKNWKLYYEFANNPTELYLTEDYIIGDAYWQLEPVPKLVELWKESIEKAIVEKEGRRLSVPKNGSTALNANSNGHSFYIPETLEVPQCIRNMHKQLQSGEIKGGFRHGVFMVIASFYSKLLPQSVVLALLKDLNASLQNSKSEDEIEKIVNDVFERGYRTGCGNPNSDLGQTCLAFCNSRASLDECPKHKTADTGLIAQRSAGAGSAFEMMQKRLRQGFSPIRFGVPEWDNIVVSGIELGNIVVLCGYPGTGKTLMTVRKVQGWAEVAKMLNMLVLVFTPETDNETVAELMTKQRGRMTKKEMYEHARNGGFDKILFDWFAGMQETLQFINAAFFTVQDVQRGIEYHEKKYSKKVMAIVLDGVLFFSPGELGKMRSPDAEVAKYLYALCKRQGAPIVGLYNLHIEKGGNDNIGDKVLAEQKPKANAGYGTIHYRNASDFYFTIYHRDGTTVARTDKWRYDYDGTLPPKEIVFRQQRAYYMIYSQEEVYQLIKTHGLAYFGNDPAFAIPAGNFKLDLRV